MKILVPVDGSAESLAAVRHALALVREGLRASLLLVTMRDPVDDVFAALLARHSALSLNAAIKAGVS